MLLNVSIVPWNALIASMEPLARPAFLPTISMDLPALRPAQWVLIVLDQAASPAAKDVSAVFQPQIVQFVSPAILSTTTIRPKPV